jgi:N-acetylmuramoyl-L-alanine amidase
MTSENGEYYVAKQGQDLKSVLFRDYGSTDVEAVVNHRDNSELFKTRCPAILYEGDRIFIPLSHLRGVRGRTGQTNAYRSGTPASASRKLVMFLKNADLEALVDFPYKVTVDGITVKGRTDDKGRLEAAITTEADTAELVVAGQTSVLKIGYLDPLITVSGYQARLNNLGFNAGPVDSIDGPKTQAGVKAFQKFCGIAVDGIVGPQTRSWLKRKYGC